MEIGEKNSFDQKILTALGIALLTTFAAAQESRSEISLQGTGFFTKDATGNGNLRRGTETAGLLIGYGYHFNRWLGAETAYGFDPQYPEILCTRERLSHSVQCPPGHGGLVVSLPIPRNLRIRPYVLAEGGALVFDPTNNTFGTVAGAHRQSTGVSVYGAGADFPIRRHRLSLLSDLAGELEVFSSSCPPLSIHIFDSIDTPNDTPMTPSISSSKIQ